MKYLRRELNQVRKRILKTIWTRLSQSCCSSRSRYKDKQKYKDTIDILKDAIAKNKPLDKFQRICGALLSFKLPE